MRVPVALLAVPLLLGAATAVLAIDVVPERFAAAAAGAAALAALAAVGFFVADEPPFLMIALVTGGVAAGYANAAAHVRDLYRPAVLAWFEAQRDLDAPFVVEGRLEADAAAGGQLQIRVLRIGRPGGALTATGGGVRLFVGGVPDPNQFDQWRAGRRIRCPALLRVPGTFANPGVPDDRRTLARTGVALTGTVKSNALVERLADGTPVQEAAAAVRAWTRATLRLHVGRIDPRSAAVATAILIGDRTGLSDDDERRLQDAGTYHVIAISGGNIAILTGLLILAGRAVRVPLRVSAAASIVVLLFYGEIAGGAASVQRAITAAVVLLTALIIDHRGSGLNLLAVAAIGAVAVTPTSVVDPGFVLSFGATAGIVIGAGRLWRATPAADGRGLRRAAHRVARIGLAMLAATLCAEAALAPVAAAFFSRITLAGVLLNFIAIPTMTVVQCGAMLVLALSALAPGSAAVVAQLVHHAAVVLIDSAMLVDYVPWVARDVAAPPWWLSLGYYACALAWAVRLKPHVARWGLAAAFMLLVTGLPSGAPAEPYRLPGPVLRVVTLDVGQGDAVLVLPPGGRPVLIDAGGLAGTTFDIAARVVVPALRALGAGRLHALVLTHGDPDHIGGAAGVIRHLRPAAVWQGVAVPRHEGLVSLAALADTQGIVWRTVRPGDVERIGGVELRVHHPPDPDWERQKVRNDDSIVTEVRYGETAVLLPGDIGASVERALIERLQLPPLVVLKAAHHGSATSSSEPFIRAVNPAAVIFSAAANSRFGHPAPLVVERFVRHSADIFSTATDGAVFVETNGRTLEVWGWKSRARVRYESSGVPHSLRR